VQGHSNVRVRSDDLEFAASAALGGLVSSSRASLSVYYPGNVKVLLPSSEALGQQYFSYYHITPSTEGTYHT
jgi:hypothetical protein